MTTATPTGAALARRFWQRALYEVETMAAEEGRGTEGGPDQPPPVTVRRGSPRYPLPPPAARLDAPRSSFASSRAAEPTGPFDPAALSTLLHHTYGLVRLEVGRGTHWPLHRTVASARCFFPTELYCVVPPTGDLPAGAYAYDPAHHSLVTVHQGDAPVVVAGPIEPPAVTIVLSTVFWRTAFMYRNYAYRLVTQEAGLVAGNAMLVAGALGLRGRLHHRFDAAAVEELLAITWPDESVLSILTLHRRDDRAAGPPSRPSGSSTDRPAVDALLCAELIDLDGAARAEPRPAAPAALADDGDDVLDLAEILRWRHSGGDSFNPVRRPIPLWTVTRVVRYALEPFESDATGAPMACYVWTPSVHDAPPAVYRLAAGRLEPLGDSTRAATRLREIADGAGIAANVNYRTANLVAFVVADIATTTTALGARSVRVLSQEAGVVAHRICVFSAAESLAARIHNGYPAGRVAEALGLPAGQAPLFQVVVGTVAPTARYQRVIGGW